VVVTNSSILSNRTTGDINLYNLCN